MTGLTTFTRRRFLSRARDAAAVAVVGGRLRHLDLLAWEQREADLWSTAAEILGRISAPVFPARDVLVTAHGATGDGA